MVQTIFCMDISESDRAIFSVKLNFSISFLRIFFGLLCVQKSRDNTILKALRQVATDADKFIP